MTDSAVLQRPSSLPAGPRSTSPRTERTCCTQRWTTALDGLKLRQLRRQHGLSQEKLADLADISLTTMVRLERHDRSPCRTYTLARLAAALGEPPRRSAPPRRGSDRACSILTVHADQVGSLRTGPNHQFGPELWLRPGFKSRRIVW